MTGVIDRLFLQLGYGFIRADDGQEYFFHRSSIVAGAVFEMLREDQPVEFETDALSAQGLRARVVRVGEGRAECEGVSYASVMKHRRVR
jgi:cold shock CspA family protein